MESAVYSSPFSGSSTWTKQREVLLIILVLPLFVSAAQLRPGSETEGGPAE